MLSFDNAGRPRPTLRDIDQWKGTIMATAAEHKSTAETLAAEAATDFARTNTTAAQFKTALAQVHATLATVTE